MAVSGPIKTTLSGGGKKGTTSIEELTRLTNEAHEAKRQNNRRKSKGVANTAEQIEAARTPYAGTIDRQLTEHLDAVAARDAARGTVAKAPGSVSSTYVGSSLPPVKGGVLSRAGSSGSRRGTVGPGAKKRGKSTPRRLAQPGIAKRQNTVTALGSGTNPTRAGG